MKTYRYVTDKDCKTCAMPLTEDEQVQHYLEEHDKYAI